MIKVSTRGHYALRAVVEMAQIGSHKPVAVAELARRQNLSSRYLEQLFARLKGAGIVDSARGFRGGYTLTKSPDKITVGQILRAVEGPLNLSRCVTSDLEIEHCIREDNCPSRLVWEKIQASINEVLNNMTLGSLISSKGIELQIEQDSSSKPVKPILKEQCTLSPQKSNTKKG